jgi:parvulin-like peptidyl-prolyl isomerase
LAKKKVEKPKREPTKRHIARWQEQKKRQRRILIAGIAVIATVGGILGSGWYAKEYQPLQQTVIRVNDTEFSMQYYIDILEFNYMYSISADEKTFIEQNELIRQEVEAGDFGITVSDSEIDEAIRSYDPPLGREYRDVARDVARVNVLMDKLLNEHFEQEVPLSAEQRHIMAMLLESEDQATEVRTRLENGEDFEQLAGELSLEDFSKTNNGNLGWHPRGILSDLLALSVPEDYAFTAEVGVLSQPIYDEDQPKEVGYWVIEVLERDEADEEEKKVHVRVMLLGSEQEAQEVIVQLEGGEDFGELAEELSQDEATKSEGGDMGWLTPEEVADDLKAEAFIFGSEPGELSEPIRIDGEMTKGGYWLVKAVDKDDNRKIEHNDRTLLKLKALDDWIASLWDNPDNEVEDYLDNEKIVWALDKAMKNITR